MALLRDILTTTVLSLGLSLPAAATYDCAADAMLVFDGSASMAEIGFDVSDATRIEEARIAISRELPRLAAARRIGLIIYGPEGTTSCSGIDLRFPPIAQADGPIAQALEGLRPAGLTPLAASVAQAAATLNYRHDPGVIVLVTDGNETCGGTPCALGDQLAATARDLTVHVIGFRVRVDFFSWDNPEQDTFGTSATVAKCLADRTGGRFHSTETVQELALALQDTLGCALIGQIGAGRGPAPS